MRKLFIALTLFTSCISTAFADMQKVISSCPRPDEAKKNTNPTKENWTAETKYGLWKSYSMSFATNLTQFVGAQWSGANIGQVTCVYKSQQVFTMKGQQVVQRTLPVLLVFHTLVFQPTGGQWKHVKRGVYNCNSSKRSDCIFRIHVTKAVGNVLEEASELKSNSKPQIQPTTH
ncbi:MAG: T4SS-associated protein EirA [Gammaproteobacteria bacterium]|nr:T4SS-associated protein EirA [Gammaproteobacteria bacterium]